MSQCAGGGRPPQGIGPRSPSGHPVSLVLVGGEETVTELAELIARRQTAISQQLARLWRSGHRIGPPREEDRADACRTARAAKLRQGRAVRFRFAARAPNSKIGVARRVQFAVGPCE